MTVTANPPPTVAISANPTAITPGSSSILTISATLATQVTVTGSDGKSSYNLAASGGTQAVILLPLRPTRRPRRGGGHGDGHSDSDGHGESRTDRYYHRQSNRHHSRRHIHSDGYRSQRDTGDDFRKRRHKLRLDRERGTQSVSPATTTIYTATAIGPGGTAHTMATVTVSANPAPTVNISANPAAVVAGNSSTLTVVATNSTQVTVTGSDGTTYNLPAAGGTQAVTPSATTTYTATATGAAGNATAAVTVNCHACRKSPINRSRDLPAPGEPFFRQLLRNAESLQGRQSLKCR